MIMNESHGLYLHWYVYIDAYCAKQDGVNSTILC